MVQKKYLRFKDYCKVKFTLNVENAETVEILGLNSDWEKAIIMNKKKDGTFSCDVSIPKNTQHQFKYLVNNNEWINDHDADGLLPNEFGGTNSVIEV